MTIRRGEIYFVNLDPNIPRDYPTNVRVSSEESGLPMETVFLGFSASVPGSQSILRQACRQGRRQRPLSNRGRSPVLFGVMSTRLWRSR